MKLLTGETSLVDRDAFPRYGQRGHIEANGWTRARRELLRISALLTARPHGSVLPLSSPMLMSYYFRATDSAATLKLLCTVGSKALPKSISALLTARPHGSADMPTYKSMIEEFPRYGQRGHIEAAQSRGLRMLQHGSESRLHLHRMGDIGTSFARSIASPSLSRRVAMRRGAAPMPARSKIAMLPKELRDELERLIVERAFSGYAELAAWLRRQGYQIAEDSVQRYGARLFQTMEAYKHSVLQAQAIAHVAPEDYDSMVDMTIALLNERVFAALMAAEELKPAEIVRFSHTVAELSRLNIARENHAYKVSTLQTREERRARERRAKASRAEAFAAVRNALSAVKAQIAPAPIYQPSSSAADFSQRRAGASGLLKPDENGQ